MIRAALLTVTIFAAIYGGASLLDSPTQAALGLGVAMAAFAALAVIARGDQQ